MVEENPQGLGIRDRAQREQQEQSDFMAAQGWMESLNVPLTKNLSPSVATNWKKTCDVEFASTKCHADVTRPVIITERIREFSRLRTTIEHLERPSCGALFVHPPRSPAPRSRLISLANLLQSIASDVLQWFEIKLLAPIANPPMLTESESVATNS